MAKTKTLVQQKLLQAEMNFEVEFVTFSLFSAFPYKPG